MSILGVQPMGEYGARRLRSWRIRAAIPGTKKLPSTERPTRFIYLDAFVEDIKANGFGEQALIRNGQQTRRLVGVI